MQHKAGPSPVLTLYMLLTGRGAHVQILGRKYKVSGGGGGDCLSGYWPLQQRHLYLRGGTYLRGSANLRGNIVVSAGN